MEKYRSLSPDSQWVLCFFAYSGVDYFGNSVYSKTLLQKLAKKSGIDLETAYSELTEKKLISSFILWRDKDYRINVSEIVGALLFMFKEHNDWVSLFSRHINTSYSDFVIIRNSIWGIVNGKTSSIDEIINLDYYVGLFVRYIDNKELKPLFVSLTEKGMFSVLNGALNDSFANDEPLDYDYLLTLVADNKNMSSEVSETLTSLVALFKYMYDGTYMADIADRYSNYLSYLLQAIRLMNLGEYNQSTSLFLKSLKLRNRISSEKNIYASSLLNFYMLMSYYLNSDGQYRTKIRQFANKGDSLERLKLSASLSMASILISEFDEYNRDEPVRILKSGKLLTNEANVLYMFARAWKLPVEKVYKPAIPAYKILRHEMADYLELSAAERNELVNLYGCKPVLTNVCHKEMWEIVFDKIEKVVDGAADTDNVTAKQRLAYLINYYGRVEVREQSVLKNGSWGAGRKVSMVSFTGGGIPFMDEADRRILADFNRSGNYELEISNVLPYMVGLPRVFTGNYAPFTQVEVLSEQVYLEVTKKGGSFVLSSNVTMKELGDIEGEYIIRKLNDATYSVIRIEPELRMYYKQLLKLKKLPQEAEIRLRNMLPKLGKVIDIHSDVFECGAPVEVKDADSKISILVRNRYVGRFYIDLRVRPLEGSTKLLRPGEGAILLFDENLFFDEKENVRYRIKRNLVEEKLNKELLESFIENDLNIVSIKNDGSYLMDTQEMLALMDFASQNSAICHIEWGNTDGLKLKGTANSGSWNLQMRSHGGWFEMEGEIHLDDNTLLSVAQLMQILAAGRNEKYVKLGEGEFIAITDALRKQLSQFEAVASLEHGTVRISPLNAALLDDAVYDGVFKVDKGPSLEELRNKIRKSKNIKVKVPNSLNATLRDYQSLGFEWMARMDYWGAGVCLADDMGLGKTVQSIAFLLHKSKSGASLVLAPVSVVPNWKKELEQFAPSLSVTVVNGTDDRASAIKQAKAGDVVLASYGMLLSNNEEFADKEWNVAVLDEAHIIKNRDTKTSAAIMKLKCSSRVILTGTPIQNNLGELWNLFHFVNPGLLGSWGNFREKFVIPIEEEKNKERQKQLKRIIRPFMLRRTKDDVLDDLPDKNEILIPVELTEEELSVYELIRRRAEKQLQEGGNKVQVQVLAEITRLRQAACSARLVESTWEGNCSKIETFANMAKTIVGGGNRALVFSQFTGFLELVRKKLEELDIQYLYLDGSTPLKQREKFVKEFQQGSVPLFLISLKAGGVGLNLVGANYVLHLDPWWNPAIEQQATDRAYRIGQRQNVTVYHLITKNTIEEKILRLHKTKRNLADALLEGADVGHKLTAAELLMMLEKDAETK